MPKAKARPIGYGENPMQMYIAPLNVESAIVASQRSFHAVAAAQTNAMKQLALMNKEIFSFVDRRLAKDRETASALARCQTPQDAVEVYAKFAETAMKDYSEEIGVLAGAYAEQAQEIIEDVQHQMQESIEAAPTRST